MEITYIIQKSRRRSIAVRVLPDNFNCLLVIMPPEILDSVVVHELCHRKYMNHSKDFYADIFYYIYDFYDCNYRLFK